MILILDLARRLHFLDDNEPSTTTPEAVIDDGSEREQQQRH